MRSALRAVVHRCSASKYARLSVLHSLSQLDRLKPGSKVEAKCKGIVPRRRGDVHPDITAAVMSFQLHGSSNLSTPRSAMSSFGASQPAPQPAQQNPQSLRMLVARSMHAMHAHDNTTESVECSLAVISSADHSAQHSATASTAAISSNLGVTPRGRQSCNLTSASQKPAVPGTSTFTAASAGPSAIQQHAKRNIAVFDSIGSIDEHAGVAAAAESPLMASDAAAQGEQGATEAGDAWECERVLLAPVEKDEARRRWGLLHTYVRVLGQEARLRRSMWDAALDAIRYPLAPAASSSQTLFSSFFLGDDRTDSGAGCKRRAGDVEGAAPRESALKSCVTACGPGQQNVGEFSTGMKEVLSQLRQRKNPLVFREARRVAGTPTRT